MKLTNIFGKQVYSLYEGEVVGTISEASFNKNLSKISCFKIFDNEENEYTLPLSNIKAFNDCIVITNKNKLEVYVGQTQTPMFKEVVNENAKCCGIICDAEVSNDGTITHFITNQNQNLKPEHIYLRKDFVYHSTSNVLMQNFKPKSNKVLTLSDINVKVFSENNTSTNFLPQKIQYNTESILGKFVKNDLLGINNEVIIKANEPITQKVVNSAKMHNRLNQLFFLAV